MISILIIIIKIIVNCGEMNFFSELKNFLSDCLDLVLIFICVFIFELLFIKIRYVLLVDVMIIILL